MKKKAHKVNSYTRLAEERTFLSNERTLLAYVQTAFAAIVFGFALIQFAEKNNGLVSVGIVAMTGGVLFLIIGLVHYKVLKKRIKHEAEDDS